MGWQGNKLDIGAELLDDERDLERLRQCVRRGRPCGDEGWVRRTARKLGLESSLRPVGRPKKQPEKKKIGFCPLFWVGAPPLCISQGKS